MVGTTPERESEELFLLRPALPTDRNFVADSWLRSSRQDHPMVPTQFYFAHRRPLVHRLLDSESTEVIVCSDLADPRHICGWLAVANVKRAVPVIHYAYVKNVYRGFGVLWRLLSSAGIGRDCAVVYTAQSKVASALAAKHHSATYCPLEDWTAL